MRRDGPSTQAEAGGRHPCLEVTMSKKQISDKQAETERQEIRTGLDETEAPTVAEVSDQKPKRRPPRTANRPR
jgi:hypothetical protein